MSSDISPLAPKNHPVLPALDGVRIQAVEAGIKYKGRTDLMVMVFDRPAQVAGVFTSSKCPSAPVDLCRKNLTGGIGRVLVVNSGNANAFTGLKGANAANETAKAAAAAAGCDASEVFLASTGVIGEPLMADKFSGLLAGMVEQAKADRWMDAAKAIMTTDTYPKVATRAVKIGGNTFVINGIAKGAGMIAPDMATMLSFIATDAAIAAPVLQAMLADSVGPTFNSVTVDSDTSTSDTVLMFATGSDGMITDPSDSTLVDFKSALASLMEELAIKIVRDGEGARKQVEIKITGAASDKAAKIIAQSIANSPLVKTAIAGEDANWGRVVMAVGKAGEEADRDKLAIWFGDVRVAVDGERDPAYSEQAAAQVMKNDEIIIRVELGIGNGQARMWTCDLTKAYVEINGDYRS